MRAGDWRIATTRASVKPEVVLGRPFWTLRGWPDPEPPLTVSMDAHREHFTMAPFPGAISVQCSTSTLSGWLSEPKRGGSSSSATIHDQALHRSTCRPPDPIQIAHFGSAANRTYITQPYSLTYPGIGIHEIEPWQEADQTWRRLAVHFPPGNANHNPDQIFNN